jgi:hypothetical protein
MQLRSETSLLDEAYVATQGGTWRNYQAARYICKAAVPFLDTVPVPV